MLDLTKLAKQHLQDAITLGYITVGGEILTLKASEILAISRYIVKEGLAIETEHKEAKQSLPSEMFSFNPKLTDEELTKYVERESSY